MRYVELSHTLQTGRIESIDALRGINMFWLMGVDGAMVPLAEMTRHKGSLVSSIGNFLGTQFIHESWEGLHFYDFIFALFIFIIGISIVLSLPASVQREGRAKTHMRIAPLVAALPYRYRCLWQHWSELVGRAAGRRAPAHWPLLLFHVTHVLEFQFEGDG